MLPSKRRFEFLRRLVSRRKQQDSGCVFHSGTRNCQQKKGCAGEVEACGKCRERILWRCLKFVVRGRRGGRFSHEQHSVRENRKDDLKFRNSFPGSTEGDPQNGGRKYARKTSKTLLRTVNRPTKRIVVCLSSVLAACFTETPHPGWGQLVTRNRTRFSVFYARGCVHSAEPNTNKSTARCGGCSNEEIVLSASLLPLSRRALLQSLSKRERRERVLRSQWECAALGVLLPGRSGS